MKKKAFPLINKGMNKDLSISKVGESCVYENRNIRITVNESETLLTVTNERGNKTALLNGTIVGTLLGWNVINEHIILFTHDNANTGDYIYRIEPCTSHDNPTHDFDVVTLFTGNLGFDEVYSKNLSIDSVTYVESDDVQKVYWVDGVHVLRFINIMADATERATWTDVSFDSNRIADFGCSVDIVKDNSGNTRPNGVVQYLLTYYNRYGQETGCVWMSDIVYLSPSESGGAADGTNTNKVTLTLSNLDTSFGYVRIYSIFRSSVDGETVAYLVADVKTESYDITVVDDGAHLTLQDTAKLLYLGSLPAVAGTIAHKDQTLFLGNIKSSGRKDYSTLEELIQNNMFFLSGSEFVFGTDWLSSCITFDYSDDSISETKDIPYTNEVSLYPYVNQLQLTSSNILTFKGGETYRFALKFQTADGAETDAFWIGDAKNDKYPYIDRRTGNIKRVVARCQLPDTVVDYLQDNGFTTARLLIAEATYADRDVKAQGVINPTMFNVWERYNNRTFAMPSWVSRPRGGLLPSRHFQSVNRSDVSTSEIQCNWWSGDNMTPYYVLDNGNYTDTFDGQLSFDYLMLIYEFTNKTETLLKKSYTVFVHVIRGIKSSPTASTDGIAAFVFSGHDPREWDVYTQDDTWRYYEIQSDSATDGKMFYTSKSFTCTRETKPSEAKAALHTKVVGYLSLDLGIPTEYIVGEQTFIDWIGDINGQDHVFSNEVSSGNPYTSFMAALDADSHSSSRWIVPSGQSTQGGTPAFFKKHIMFVDENIVTLDSPELSYGAVSVDEADYNFRIVGVARMGSIIADSTADASTSGVPGDDFDGQTYSGTVRTRQLLDGLTAWPMWKDFELKLKDGVDKDVEKRTSDDYTHELGSRIIRYWLYMWQHGGSISTYNDEDGNNSILSAKTFANIHISNNTIYLYQPIDLNVEVLRQPMKGVGSYYNIKVNDTNRFYSGDVELQLTMPGTAKYPIYYSMSMPDSSDHEESTDSVSLYSADPVMLSYMSDTHAVVSLGTTNDGKYNILPYFFPDEGIVIPQARGDISGALIPWEELGLYPIVIIVDSDVTQPNFVGDLSYDDTRSKVSLEALLGSDPIPVWYYAIRRVVESVNDEHVYTSITTSSYKYIVDIKNVQFNTYVHPGYSEDRSIRITDADVLYRINREAESSIAWDIRMIQIEYEGTPPNYSISQSGYLSKQEYHLHNNSVVSIPGEAYKVNNKHIAFVHNSPDADIITDNDSYLMIGEIYTNVAKEARYGGITESAVAGNRFITAGPAYKIASMVVGGSNYIYANQGDTYFQRWDSMRTMPNGVGGQNDVIDITSFMVETHINLDGRTDKQRGMLQCASIDIPSFGQLNPVYSQKNNFIVRRDMDERYNTDAYKSTLTWTLQKSDLADIDEWTHVTLASSLKLDADKGECNALRRFRNNLLAFQDKGIAEILYNSRTQLTTDNGVPIEVGNSGKVDGKVYLTNTYGCTDRHSIVEGGRGLYFLDSISRSFCSFNGESIENISSKLGFDQWFSENIAGRTNAFFDSKQSDIYLVKHDTSATPCLCYSEKLGVFTSFYDYDAVDMMVNIGNRFVSYNDNNLWLQNEGLYCNFFGTQYPFYIQYRVAPSPYSDKIWTNLEYKADFYRVLNADGSVPQGGFHPSSSNYQDSETFNSIRFWNEYQTTPSDTDLAYNVQPVKRFRMWNLPVPRAKANGGDNSYGLDRIRNPWVNMILKKTFASGSDSNNRDMMQLHDVIISYYE